MFSVADSSSLEAVWGTRNGPGGSGSGSPWWEFSSAMNSGSPGNSEDNPQQFNASRGLFPCPQCNKVYQYKYTLGTHLRYECGKEPQFQCPYCPHRSKLKGNLMKHIRKIHASIVGSDWRNSRADLSESQGQPSSASLGAQLSHEDLMSK
ncbi:Longitudinals lacking protein, isoforms A/B/D/L [Frankliniella fusca]|uniref:Longitudinals lacking protein, isoforms A/B/D/L n=1 Tax=Frankliniella fusca TaxID=407009 RepID=A0AAE1H6I1_9NEOP|nr:Longitudinals lacking protein, isoforms A/B/D/L [Frankliniella fusca]